MSTDSSSDRPASDEELRAMCDLLRWKTCKRWRKGYGYTGTLHFGELQPVSRSEPGMVDRDEGTVLLNLWSCHRVLRNARGAPVLDSRVRRHEAELESLILLEGSRVLGIDLNASQFGLTLRFLDGQTLELLPDPALVAADDEHWAIELHDGPSIGVFGRAVILSSGGT